MAIYSQTSKDITKYQGRNWIDLDLNFGINPATKDIRKKIGENALKQSIKNLLMTNRGERLFEPEIFGGIYQYLFEPLSPFTAVSIKDSVTNVINTLEPRVVVREVTVSENSNQDGYDISIDFSIFNSEERLNVEFFLERLR